MMTDRDLALINRLIYHNPPENTLRRVGCCLTAGMMARELMARPPNCAKDDLETLGLVSSSKEVGELLITQYINHNDTNGFVAFALESPRGFTILAFRGSESTSGCVPTNVDWVDNVLTPFNRSMQYADVERLINGYETGEVISTGHSKGGHNAIYSIAVARNPSAKCVAFDAQGFSSGQLTPEQKSIVSERAVNYVYRRDLVGALLCHPERRVFVKGTTDVHAHALEAIAFDLDGNVMPSYQAIVPRLIGFGTCALKLPLRAKALSQT